MAEFFQRARLQRYAFARASALQIRRPQNASAAGIGVIKSVSALLGVARQTACAAVNANDIWFAPSIRTLIFCLPAGCAQKEPCATRGSANGSQAVQRALSYPYMAGRDLIERALVQSEIGPALVATGKSTAFTRESGKNSCQYVPGKVDERLQQSLSVV